MDTLSSRRMPFCPVVLFLRLPVHPSAFLHRTPPLPLPSLGGGLSIAPANLAVCMIEVVYSQVRTAFTASEQPHYQFTARDLTQWVASALRLRVHQVGMGGVPPGIVRHCTAWCSVQCTARSIPAGTGVY